MTENTNPKPFNISRQKCLGLSINQSINQHIHIPSNWLNRIQIKDYQNVKGSFTDWVNLLHVFV